MKNYNENLQFLFPSKISISTFLLFCSFIILLDICYNKQKICKKSKIFQNSKWILYYFFVYLPKFTTPRSTLIDGPFYFSKFKNSVSTYDDNYISREKSMLVQISKNNKQYYHIKGDNNTDYKYNKTTFNSIN